MVGVVAERGFAERRHDEIGVVTSGVWRLLQ